MSNARLVQQIRLVVIRNYPLLRRVRERDLVLVQLEDRGRDQIDVDSPRAAELSDFSCTLLVSVDRADPFFLALVVDRVVLLQDAEHVVRRREVKADREIVNAGHLEVDSAKLALTHDDVFVDVLLIVLILLHSLQLGHLLRLLQRVVVLLVLHAPLCRQLLCLLRFGLLLGRERVLPPCLLDCIGQVLAVEEERALVLYILRLPACLVRILVVVAVRVVLPNSVVDHASEALALTVATLLPPVLSASNLLTPLFLAALDQVVIGIADEVNFLPVTRQLCCHVTEGVEDVVRILIALPSRALSRPL